MVLPSIMMWKMLKLDSAPMLWKDLPGRIFSLLVVYFELLFEGFMVVFVKNKIKMIGSRKRLK